MLQLIEEYSKIIVNSPRFWFALFFISMICNIIFISITIKYRVVSQGLIEAVLDVTEKLTYFVEKNGMITKEEFNIVMAKFYTELLELNKKMKK